MNGVGGEVGDIVLDEAEAEARRNALFGDSATSMTVGEAKKHVKADGGELKMYDDADERTRSELMAGPTPGEKSMDMQEVNVGVELGDLNLMAPGVDFAEDDIDRFLDNPLVKEALAGGMDLRQYARQIEVDLRRVERASIQDYVEQTSNLMGLHDQIQECDAILETMETLLSGFQEDLGNISTEIKTLQDKSLSLNVSLRNRKEVEGKLTRFVENIAVTPDMIRAISEGPINEQFMQHLMDLDKKIAFCQSDMAQDTKASQDVQAQLSDLRLRAVVRIRDFLVKRIYSLRKPKTNIQVRQQNVLLKYKFLNTFLQTHSREVAREVRDTYVETLSKIYQSYFKSYFGSLMKLQEEICDKTDLIGVDENQKKGFFSQKPRNRKLVFSLGGRAEVLKELDAPVIVVHVAQQQGTKLPYEVLYRSMSSLLMDTATAEFLFCLDFFGKSEVFNLTFDKSMQTVMEHIEGVVANSYDAIGLLLCIRIVHHHQLTMNKRRVPCLDSLFDRIRMVLWPRFKQVFDLHINSVRAAQPKMYGAISMHSHYVTRQYAEFVSAIITLDADFNDATMPLNRLRQEFVRLLRRLSMELKGRKKQLVFLLNNYYLILQVISERTSTSTDAEQFTDLLKAHAEEFVEEELAEDFRPLIQFVMEMEAYVGVEAPDKVAARCDSAGVTSLVKDFSQNWKARIKAFDKRLMSETFDSLSNGLEILQRVLTQLIVYYRRFLDIIEKTYRNPPFRSDLVDYHKVMVECKNVTMRYDLA